MYFVVDSAVCICNRLGKIAQELENPVFALTFYLCLLDEAVKSESVRRLVLLILYWH